MDRIQSSRHYLMIVVQHFIQSVLRGISVRTCFSAAIMTIMMVLPLEQATAQSASDKGLQVANAVRATETGYGGFTADVVMTLRNRQGQESNRELRFKQIETDDANQRVIFAFDTPRDVKGTAFLVHKYRTKADDQWLYLPALKRVKRISSSNRSGSFMGSEFAYEDMSSPEVEKYMHTWLRDEACGNLTCAVIEMVPLEKGSGYSRQLRWIDTGAYRTWKVEFYDRRNAHMKTLTLSGYDQHAGKHWRASDYKMVNHLTGKSTDLRWTKYDFNANLSARDFTQTGLRRVR